MAWARAAVSANCAREMACRTAERTRLFHCLGRGMTKLNGWPGMRTSEKNFQGIGAGL